ncbi:hypothetical protein R1flu_015203 [Riccia fluitans]|uniref:Uncharacterized protein n=1 Tax=Riccia fluitans TaxID=41844 RepID=A0ABD1YM22_9MARC
MSEPAADNLTLLKVLCAVENPSGPLHATIHRRKPHRCRIIASIRPDTEERRALPKEFRGYLIKQTLIGQGRTCVRVRSIRSPTWPKTSTDGGSRASTHRLQEPPLVDGFEATFARPIPPHLTNLGPPSCFSAPQITQEKGRPLLAFVVTRNLLISFEYLLFLSARDPTR